MALTITRNEKIFKVKGQINSITAGYFKTHFTITLNSSKELTIDINEVTEIDQSGVKAFESIYNDAQSWNKPFYILGAGNKSLLDELRSSKVA